MALRTVLLLSAMISAPVQGQTARPLPVDSVPSNEVEPSTPAAQTTRAQIPDIVEKMDKLRLAVKSLAFEALELRISEGGPVQDIRGLVDAVRVSMEKERLRD